MSRILASWIAVESKQPNRGYLIAMSDDAYKLWYAYLKETNPDTWSEEVRRDFGGVLTESFEEWFSQAYFELWLPLKAGSAPVRQYDANTEIPEMRESEIAVVIDLDRPKDALIRSLDWIISFKQGPRKAGRPPFVQLPSVKYPFACRPDVPSLEIALAAWKLKKDTDWHNWKVGNELAKTFPILRAQKIKEGDLDSTAKQKVLESVTWRYLQTADAVLAGVVKGIFPAK